MTTEGRAHPSAPGDLPSDLVACHALIRQLIEQHREREQTIAGLEHQLQQLLRRMYGRSSEKLGANQQVLFAELLGALQSQQEQSAAPAVVEPLTAPTQKPSSRGHGRRQIPADLPRERVEVDLPDQEKPCPCCGEMRQRIGEEISEKLDWVPAKLKVLQTVRPKYACRGCDAAGNGAQVAVAELPLSPIEKGLAAPGLLAQVIVSKYADHAPLHRLEKIFQRHGIEIARSTMCDWVAQSAAALRPLYELMTRRVLASKVLHTDDTPVDVLEKGRRSTRTGRFWVYCGDDDHPYHVFDYTPSRKRDGPMNFLRGWGKDERRYLQADAFGGYDGIYAGEAGGRVSEVACMSHCRRKFYDARGSDHARSAQALAFIRLLYDVEDEAKRRFAEQAEDENAHSLSSIRLELRRALSVPRLAQFKAWLQSQQAVRGGPVLPRSPMGQAITYAMNQWEALCIYTTDGDLAIDNNISENALRRVAVGRGNWLFCGSDNGGSTAAILFSVIATCDRHQLNPWQYLRDVLSRIAAQPISRLAELLPDQWQPAAAPSSLTT